MGDQDGAAGQDILTRTITWLSNLYRGIGAHIAALGVAIGAVVALPSAFGWKDLDGWQIAFIAILASGPLICALLFKALPEWREARRIERLKHEYGDLVPPEPDYFRLRPYGSSESDRAHFDRIDKVHEQILRWIQHSTSNVLYLSGRSGVGKSSLLASYVAPMLSTGGKPWRVVEVRALDDPIGKIRRTLMAPDIVWRRAPIIDDICELVDRAARHLEPNNLLVILDQFEEFVVLNRSVELIESIERLLRHIQQSGPTNLRVLIAIRSDYIALMQKLNLPPLHADENWCEVPPFTIAAARRFLANAKLNLTQQKIEDILSELDAVEETAGLVRPIALNMMGLILARFGGGQPSRYYGQGLLIGYVREVLLDPELCMSGPLLVGHLLSGTGNKVAKSEDQLATESKTDIHVVAASLRRLSKSGVVRLIDPNRRVWEVSHDFVARIMGHVLPRLRDPWIKRFRIPLTWGAIGFWAFALTISIPLYQGMKKNRVLEILAAHEVALKGTSEAGFRLEIFQYKKPIAEADWGLVADVLPIAAIQVRQCECSLLPNFSHFEQLKTLEILESNVIVSMSKIDIPSLETLKISENKNLITLPEIRNLSKLQSIEISENRKVLALPEFKGLTTLRNLEIAGNESLTLIPSLSDLTQLQSLTISENKRLTSLPKLAGLHQLESLKIDGNESLLSIPELGELTTIKSITISENKSLLSVPALNTLSALQSIEIRGNRNLRVIPALSDLRMLRYVGVFQNPSLVSVTEIGDLVSLEFLSIHFNEQLTNIPALAQLQFLKSLTISKNEKLVSIPDLNNLRVLKSLTISENRSLTQLPDIGKLSLLEKLAISDNDNVSLLPDLSELRNLQELSIRNNRRLIRMPTLPAIDGIVLRGLEACLNSAYCPP